MSPLYLDVHSAGPAALSHKTSTPYELRWSTTIITSLLTLPSTAHLHTTITIALAAPPSPFLASFTITIPFLPPLLSPLSSHPSHTSSSRLLVPFPLSLSLSYSRPFNQQTFSSSPSSRFFLNSLSDIDFISSTVERVLLPRILSIIILKVLTLASHYHV